MCDRRPDRSQFDGFNRQMPAFQRGRPEIDGAGMSILIYNLHQESRANDALRLRQLNEVLRDVSTHCSECRLILAGDLNLNAAKTGPAEKLFAEGFCSAVPSARIATTPARHLLEAGRHID